MSSITSKLIRNAPGTDGAVADGSGPPSNSSSTTATNEAPSPGTGCCRSDLNVLLVPVYNCDSLFVLAKGSEEKTSPAALTRHATSNRADQSHSDDVTGNNDEQVGDRWEEDEDWGSLEV